MKPKLRPQTKAELHRQCFALLDGWRDRCAEGEPLTDDQWADYGLMRRRINTWTRDLLLVYIDYLRTMGDDDSIVRIRPQLYTRQAKTPTTGAAMRFGKWKVTNSWLSLTRIDYDVPLTREAAARVGHPDWLLNTDSTRICWFLHVLRKNVALYEIANFAKAATFAFEQAGRDSAELLPMLRSNLEQSLRIRNRRQADPAPMYVEQADYLRSLVDGSREYSPKVQAEYEQIKTDFRSAGVEQLDLDGGCSIADFEDRPVDDIARFLTRYDEGETTNAIS